MRILFILTSLGMGGAEKQTVTLAEHMAARGHTIAFLVLTHAEEEWPLKLPVLRLNMSKDLVGFARGLRFAKKFLSIFEPDILHSHTYPANIFARLLRLTVNVTTKGGSRPLLLNTIHNVFEGGWLRTLSYKLTSRLVDHVTAVSEAAANRYVLIGAVQKKKMAVMTNAIDLAAYVPSKTRRKEVRTRMQAKQAFVWLAAGRIAAAKDYPNLLSAFDLLRKKLSSQQALPHLWIAGDGDFAELNPNGTDLGGAVSLLGLRRDIPDLMDAADGFVLSSAWEGMPLVVGEAMAMRMPVAATRVGGVAELIGDAGCLVPPQDCAALAESMFSIMAMSERARKQLGDSARERIETHFSMDVRAAEWESSYSRLLMERKR